jgi:hypothetical protein
MSDSKQAVANDSITVGNGANEPAAQVTSIVRMMCDKHGNKLFSTKLMEVTHLPSGKFNLFSLTRMQNQGWFLLNGNKEAVWLTKGKQMVTFDMVILTNKGLLFAVYFKRGAKVTVAVTDLKPEQMSIDKAHQKLRHSNETATRKVATAIGYDLTRGVMKVCEACTMAKAKQKNVPKTSDHEPAQSNGHRVFLDIATIKKTSRNRQPVNKSNW